ncbi:hypothetical protein B0T16DRAFT_463066 [Cercophora newfieldiana]|uniref:Flavin-containing monooxygenase n=1 Tax=Cercophora newfieldiana TaxID=92897 RepID=A0AA40CJ35_9PEZI|nr:hypothetical protein B0T16DRAFT_463066 [Cercophora newfieldiana]
MSVPIPIKRVAVIGAGLAGAIAVDALAQENTFDLIRVFERREGLGGCRIGDTSRPPTISDLSILANRTADPPIPIPENLPAQTPKLDQPRFAESSVYPYLETNVDNTAMEFTQESIPEERSEWSIATHGPNTPFRHWKVMRQYVSSLLERNGYQDFVSYNTIVERVEKVGAEWKWFDAVVVVSGYYWVPYIPAIEGLEQFEKSRPGSVLHSKHFRGRDLFRGKRVVIVGASVSAADIAVDLASTKTADLPVHAIVKGHNTNVYFGDIAFQQTQIKTHPSNSHIAGRTVHLIDGNSIPEVDHIIFGTGYSWTLPLPPPGSQRAILAAGLIARQSQPSSSLSKGATIGLGVGLTVGALLLIFGGCFITECLRRKGKMKGEPQPYLSVGDAYPGAS